jgi:signal transduction histidine kinase
MAGRLQQGLHNLTLAQRFMLGGLVILIVGMALIGVWVEQQIEEGVVHRSAATTALYVDSFITPNLQELATGETISPMHQQALERLLHETPFGQRISTFKVWSRGGRVVYSTDAALIGQSFPIEPDLQESLDGEVAASISDLQAAENVNERATQSRLLEMYSPVRENGTGLVIGAAEFYYTVDALDGELTAAQQRTWLVVGLATVVMYLLLSVFVRQASQTINRQRTALSAQVTRQAALLVENEALNERVRRAAARTAALNERALRRVSAELHDGPAQDLGVALLRLDHILARGGVAAPHGAAAPDGEAADLEFIGTSLRRAMGEIRAISSGLGVPQLENWTLTETLSRVISAHERQTGTKVAVTRDCPREQVALPVKITVYRLVQEGLRNAYRHAGGAGQQVLVHCAGDTLRVEVVDGGPGFDPAATSDSGEHLGLAGMRERVESLGGVFQIESVAGQGTRLRADLPLTTQEDA